MDEAPVRGMDVAQVEKAVQALLAYRRNKENHSKLLLNEHERISLMLTVWKIPNSLQTIRIPLPNSIRSDTCEVCIFTKDEPNMSSEQTENFYKKMFAKFGISQITEIIPLKKMKTEYKPYEAKRRLLGSFDLFLADARIRRLLPSHIGKHFYKEKKEPQSVNLKAKHLASELNRFIQGTQLHINNKGCCYSIRVGHTGMEMEHIVENALAVAKVLAEKLPMKWKNVKILHLKTQTSVALPIYNSTVDNLKSLDSTQTVNPKHTSDVDDKEEEDEVTETIDHTVEEEDEEDIPKLVPIEDPAATKKVTSQKIKTSKTLKKKAKAASNIIEPPLRGAKKLKISDKVIEEAETPSKKKSPRMTSVKSPKISAIGLTKPVRKTKSVKKN